MPTGEMTHNRHPGQGMEMKKKIGWLGTVACEHLLLKSRRGGHGVMKRIYADKRTL